MAKTIYFYNTKDLYGEFSNFSRHPITIENVKYPTSEHYFQSIKALHKDRQEAIRNAATPALAAAMGRDRKYPIKPDWESIKEDVMMTALRAKFTQHPELKQLLLDTKDAILVEHTEKDGYWGDNLDGSGKNRLGILLMSLREHLKCSFSL